MLLVQNLDPDPLTPNDDPSQTIRSILISLYNLSPIRLVNDYISSIQWTYVASHLAVICRAVRPIFHSSHIKI